MINFTRFSLQDQILFAKRLAILMKSGVPIVEAFQILIKQTKSPAVKKILEQIVKDLENGQYLSHSLARFHKVFGEFAINIIQVGEVSGTLHENLNHLAEELKKKQTLKRKIISALIYPAIIVVATFGIIMMLTIFLFPKILPIFASVKAGLPMSTKILIWISNLLIHYGVFIFTGLVIVVMVGFFLMKLSSVRILTDRLLLRLPVFGGLIQSYQMANFTRTLGILLKSDVAIVRATNIVAKTTKNLAYQREFFILAENLTKGEKISTHLERNLKLFPSMLAQMISVGEYTGNLSATLTYLADVYEDEVDEVTKNLSTILEPALMLIIGLMVGFIAVSIITPIYGITQHLAPK